MLARPNNKATQAKQVFNFLKTRKKCEILKPLANLLAALQARLYITAFRPRLAILNLYHRSVPRDKPSLGLTVVKQVQFPGVGLVLAEDTDLGLGLT